MAFEKALYFTKVLLFGYKRPGLAINVLVRRHHCQLLAQFTLASPPRYLEPFNSTADVRGQRALRSAGTNQLVVPPVRLSTVGSRAFPVAAAQIWNSLPEHIVSAPR